MRARQAIKQHERIAGMGMVGLFAVLVLATTLPIFDVYNGMRTSM
ncbi:hypothetical protein [Parapedobacter tibetensis]|nr:hypothetical protein [Parapedobacter tibetensis]